MRVTVFGSARIGEDSDDYHSAVQLGRLLASRGYTVVTGGYGGLMEAVSRGAHEAHGQVIGVTMAPWDSRLSPNPYISEVRAAESLFARIEVLVESDALVALTGGAGTLAEVTLAWNLRQMSLMAHKPIILVGLMWQRLLEAFRKELIVGEADLAMLTIVSSVDEVPDMLDGTGAEEKPTWAG